MHIRRLAAFLLGAWIGGSLFMIAITFSNLRSADRLLAVHAPAMAQMVKVAGPAAGRLLRYQAAELTRWHATVWEWTQLGLGALLLAVLVAGSQERKAALLLCTLMLLTVVVMRLFLTKEIERLGPAWFTAETIKLVLALALAANLLHRSQPHAPGPGHQPRWVRAH